MLDRRQRQRRTAGLSRTAHTATGGLLARDDGTYEFQNTKPGLYSLVFPASPESLADGVVVKPGVLGALTPATIVAGPA